MRALAILCLASVAIVPTLGALTWINQVAAILANL